MANFPPLPIFTGYNAPGRTECDTVDLAMEGRVPSELNGTFFRVAPDPQWPPLLGNDLYFSGDGHVTSFRFAEGRVDMKSRYVRTDKFAAEMKAGRALFGAYRNPYFDDPSVMGLSRGTANTNVVVHHGKLLALKEDSPPVEMDPISLRTVGSYDFGGTLTSETYTAHPKVDPLTGDLVGFAYAAKGLCTRDIVYIETDPSGKIKREVWLESPYYCMIHDFGVTKDYVVFPVAPIVGSLQRCKEGKPHFGWDKTKELMLGVLPRNGEADDIRWFRGPAQFASHVTNAFNEGNKLYLDMPVAPGNSWPFFPDIDGSPFDPERARASMTRWTLDLGRNDTGFASERLSSLTGEFPRIDDRYATQQHSHGWWVSHDPTRPFDAVRGGSISGPGWNAWVHLDYRTGKTQVYFPGPTSTVQELAFAPRSSAAPEGDGYIIGLVNRFDSRTTDLVVIDAQRLNEGAIATVHLPIRLRNGLHGNWVPVNQLGAASHR